MDNRPQYIEYKGLPLVREGDVICYGDLSEKYMLLLNIISKKPDGEPDGIIVQICQTDDRTKIKKQSFKNGLFDAIDLGVEWLEYTLKEENV